MRSHILLLVPVLALFGPTAHSPAQDLDNPEFTAALKRYREVMQRLPFRHHTEGREKLASTRCVEALQLLIKDYTRPPSYPDYARYTLAHLIGRNFDRDQFTPQLESLFGAFDQPIDMWMWVHTLRILTDRKGEEATIKIATESKKAMHRAAAILALGESRKGHLKTVIQSNCLEFPRKEAERAILVGAMSGALLKAKDQVNEAGYRLALEAYINLLSDDVGLSPSTQLQMARHLQWILHGPALFRNREPWLELLNRGEVKAPPKHRTTAQPSFFGIESEGERFCYVIDMSDSMCKEISPSARPSNAPITGKRPKRKKGIVPSQSDLPWHLIKTRWDLAREQLRISLWRLPTDKHFSVIWFGSEAGTFDSCKGMIRATKRNVDRLMAELDGIKPVPAKTEKEAKISPDGILRGKTNLHMGLRMAFGITKRGYIEEAAYVDPRALTEGCDTIFLLSDGAPSWDEFHIRDRDYGEGNVVHDTEYGEAAPRTPMLIYHGPYSQYPAWLTEDVNRMNAFRRIRMHCVGLGEANMRLLRSLAEMGNGETFAMGARKKK